MARSNDGVSMSQEMQSQVETLSLTQSPLRTETQIERQESMGKSLALSSEQISSGIHRPQLSRDITSAGVRFCTSNKWSEFYPDREIVVVSNIGDPPLPPEGYVPLRRGHCRAYNTPETALTFKENGPNGFSLDTLLWDDSLLEQRIMQLTAWTRRPPMPRRQKLDCINRMVNRCTYNT